MSLVEEILKDYEHLVESLSLIPSDGGKFEVSVNGQLIYSKLDTKRHAEAGEIVNIISKMAD
ncbi:MAG: SelT/SelW/SelH family protein [Chloroflexi bacterium]|nr:SelT/SelW/SelH family protein [Chloroflexota bacterium]